MSYLYQVYSKKFWSLVVQAYSTAQYLQLLYSTHFINILQIQHIIHKLIRICELILQHKLLQLTTFQIILCFSIQMCILLMLLQRNLATFYADISPKSKFLITNIYSLAECLSLPIIVNKLKKQNTFVQVVQGYK